MQTSIIDLLVPTEIQVETVSDQVAKITLEPLERGFGHTLGNALRRILLSSMPGAAITNVNIEGISHEYSTIDGVREDVIDILLNLKDMPINIIEGSTAEIKLDVSGPSEVKAGMFEVPGNIELVNEDHHIASLVDKVKLSLIKRKREEALFKFYGLIGIISAILFLIIILYSVISQGQKAFFTTFIKVDVYFDSEIIDPENKRNSEDIQFADFGRIISESLKRKFPHISDKSDVRELASFISTSEADNLAEFIVKNKNYIGESKIIWLLASSTIDVIVKNPEMEKLIEEDRLISDKQLDWLNQIKSNNELKRELNKNFFTKADSTEPEQAGIWGSLVGSFLTLIITLILSFPVAVAAGVFLEELAPKNKFTEFLEVNINNLAAVPSIIFGLLGLAIFLNIMHLPRSAPIVGGMVLALMTLPTIIIATRSSLKSVPPSIREAAIGLGATKFQSVIDHVLPLAIPGIMTGTIIGMSRALGESAPLLMIGMVAFIVDAPGSFLDSSTALPVQIYLWKSTAARGFVELTAAGVIVLLAFLILMNGLAVFLRQKFEKKW